MWNNQDIFVTQILRLREIIVGESKVSKSAIFQKPFIEPLKSHKTAILKNHILHNGVHVKSEWQKNPETSHCVFPIRLPRSVL